MPLPLAARLAALIEAEGPIPIHAWMAACAAHYYARLPFGRDFTTAPEVSQVFGELIGAWAADLWHRAGRPPVTLVELGPGRGTLMADMLRAGNAAGFAPPVAFVETSPRLRVEQAGRVPEATWHDSLDTVPDDAAAIVIGNEFLDALPVRQLVRGPDGWRERCVGRIGDGFGAVTGARVSDTLVPAAFANADQGSIVELCPAAAGVAAEVAARLARRGGAALFVDYGYSALAPGSTLQALRDGRAADPFNWPGEADLTAHVDFSALAAAASACRVHGPVGQGTFLEALRIGPRTAALAAARPDRAAGLWAATTRLTSPQAMGTLFRALALTAPQWPKPAGF